MIGESLLTRSKDSKSCIKRVVPRNGKLAPEVSTITCAKQPLIQVSQTNRVQSMLSSSFGFLCLLVCPYLESRDFDADYKVF